MNCAYHKEQPVQGICCTCGQPICDQCLVDLSGHPYCKTCLTARIHKPTRSVVGVFRFMLSVFPGLGHLYMGMFQRGLHFMLAAVFGSIMVGMVFPPLLGFYIPAVIFFSIFDAREIHLRLAQGWQVDDKGLVDLAANVKWNPRYLGYGLVSLGGLALYHTLMHDFLAVVIQDGRVLQQLTSTMNGLMLGALAIGAGVWLLRRDMRGSSN